MILDCRLEDTSGSALCARLKQNPATRDIPVVGLIAAGAESQHLDLLKSGIDEVFSRPFAPVKLLGYLRDLVAAQASDARSQGERTLSYGGIELSQETYRVHCGGQEIYLPPIEFRMLRHLLQSPGTVFSRKALIKAAWPDGAPADARSVDVHIARLRKALKTVLQEDVIRTVRSAGYALNHQPLDEKLGHTPV